ncbi:hypothetical protein JYU34_000628 [Plutella xylostella]|uniref:HTH psq-type domain-containing protein n=1 Tax=Plutella xylostella TaxID=51655 RepID=A0ABQ7R882_PLUXY|nr:hypothetical protein JYU34_000628 [Plutella xylostella]
MTGVVWNSVFSSSLDLPITNLEIWIRACTTNPYGLHTRQFSNIRNARMAATRKYYEWNETSMKLAITALKKKKCGLNEASRVYGVPKATLKCRFNGTNKNAKEEKQV